MNNHYDDYKIAADFDRLRQVERGLTPRFSSLLKGSCEIKPRYTPLQLSAGFAVAVLTLSILSVIALRPDNDINDLQHSADGFQLSSIDELPTDFLLETPWSQLASLGPEPQLLDLPYDLLEELPDEP